MLEPPTIHHNQRAPSGPLHPRPEDLHFQVAYALLVRCWGVTRTRRNHGVVHLLRALCGRPKFRAGDRVAWSTTKIASVIKVEPRTVTTIIAKLRELPELITIRTVRRGEVRWNGTPARLTHLDWQQGPALRRRLAELASSSVASPTDLTSGLHGSHVPRPTDVASPDLAFGAPSDDELKAALPATERLNFKDPNPGSTFPPLPPAADTPAPPTTPTEKTLPGANSYGGQRPAPMLDAGQQAIRSELRPPRKVQLLQQSTTLDVRRLAHPVQMLAVIIRTVLGRGDHLRLHPDEFYLVDGALRCVVGQYSPEAIPELVDQVLALALKDHARARAERRTTRDRPTLAYVFGGPDDAPHLPHRYFLDRVSLIRERQLEAEKHQRSEDHAQLGKLFFRGGTEPTAPRGPTPPPPVRSRKAVMPINRPQRQTPAMRLSAEEIDAALAQVEASWEQPYRASTG